MRHDRALDGDNDEESAAAAEERDVLGGGDVDPVPVPARSRRRATPRPAVDGAACIACFEPLLPTGPVCVVIVGGVMPCLMHVDCADPLGVDAPFDCTRRLF